MLIPVLTMSVSGITLCEGAQQYEEELTCSMLQAAAVGGGRGV